MRASFLVLVVPLLPGRLHRQRKSSKDEMLALRIRNSSLENELDDLSSALNQLVC
jgi:hypothetical protein